MIESHTCNHPGVPHTLWYWTETTRPQDGPVAANFDNLEDADRYAQKVIRQNADRLSWLKIFRSDNEIYTCFRWEQPNKEQNMVELGEQKVKLEVDMQPLVEAFDNISQGFKEQGQSIKRLWLLGGALSASFAAHLIDHILR